MADESAEIPKTEEKPGRSLSTLSPSSTDAFAESLSKAFASLEQNGKESEFTRRFDINEVGGRVLPVFRKELTELQGQYPELVGATVYGSQVKGNATEKSDIDSFLFIDPDLTGDEEKAKEVAQEIREAMQEKMAPNFAPGTNLKDIRVSLISKEKIERDVKDLVDYYNSPNPDPFGVHSDEIGILFHMQVGHGLDSYRRQVLDGLSVAGEAGEKAWRIVIGPTLSFEGNSAKGSYKVPETIAEARKYFKLENRTQRGTQQTPEERPANI